MFKFKSYFVFILLLTFSCNKKNQTTKTILQETPPQTVKVSKKDIEKIKYTDFVLSDLSEKNIENWLKFLELQEKIDLLKKGDLSFFKEDKTIIQSFITDLKIEIPEALNIPSILVRLSIIETTMLKLESISKINTIEKEQLINTIKNVLVSNSNIILQMNKKFEKDSQNIQKPN